MLKNTTILVLGVLVYTLFTFIPGQATIESKPQKAYATDFKAPQALQISLPEKLSAVTTIQPPPAPKKVEVPIKSAPVDSCGDNEYAHFIYMHESGCRTNAINPIGACGLGQSWPCKKMGCSLDNYNCQNAWFSGYAQQRYGGWKQAYEYWLVHHNW